MLKKNDFVEVEYTGRIKDDEIIFDTTDEKIAKDNGIHNPRMKYGELTVCLGQGQMIPGLDRQLEGKEIGKRYTIDIGTAEAFGKKDPKLVQLVSTAQFKKANINAMPGLQVNIDNQTGIIKAVSGGRTIVDFNHPLSGKDVVYDVKIIKTVDDETKKLSVLAGAMLQIEEPMTMIKEGNAVVTLAFDLPADVHDVLFKKIKEILPGIKEIKFIKKDESSGKKSNSEENNEGVGVAGKQAETKTKKNVDIEKKSSVKKTDSKNNLKK